MSKRVNNAKGVPSKNRGRGFQYRFAHAEKARLIKEADQDRKGDHGGAIEAAAAMIRSVFPKRKHSVRRGNR